MPTENWKKFIFENEHETLFETDNIQEMYDYLNEFQETRDRLDCFENVYETAHYYTIHFAGYNLMLKK
jgi:hypothetical protein